jgi:hypothetical protein
MTFTVTITDPASLAGITAARTAYNASLPPQADGTPSPDTLADDEAYVQFVMATAALSYARQYGT